MSTYGIAVYGVDEFSSDILPLQGITRIYIGCEPTDGKEANGVFDEFQLFFENKSDADITAMFNATQPSVYSSSHQLLAPFDSNIDGGNLQVDGLQVENWRIYRKLSDDTQYKYVKTVVNNSANEFSETYDYECANNVAYDYAIEGIASNGLVTNKFEVSNVSLSFDGYWLIDKNNGNTFQFKYNRNDANFSSEVDRIETKTFSQFPVIVRSEVNYERGNLESIKVNNPYQEMNALKQFEGSDGLVLKFDTGEMYPVDIYNLSRSYLAEYGNQVGTIKCDWVQVGEIT